MNSIDRKRCLWVVVSALAQGLLLGAYSVTRSGPFLCVPLTLVVIVPFVFWLAQEHWGRRLRRFLMGLSLVLAVFYAYRLWSVWPVNDGFFLVPSQRMDVIRACMAVFLLIPFFQCRIATWSWRMPYSEIFFQLCRNLFLLFQAVIVMAVFWGLLLTASLLFDIVGLNFVPYVLFHPMVAVPLSTLTIAVSIFVALKHPGIDSLGRWILSILAWLLPPFSLLSVVFVACLPYSGLRTLWSTGQASSLILLLELGTILLANAAWLDGTRSPFTGKAVNALSQISLLCLPFYTVICLYSLGLRVEQYGLSVDRIQAAFLAVVTGIWGVGYAGAVLMRQWPSAIGRVNVAAALMMTLLVAAMNSPLLDPYRLAANNQADRLLGGRIAPEDFDYLYMRFSLGRYGNYALERLRESRGPRADSIRKRIVAAMAVDPEEYLRDLESSVAPASQRREILNNARVYPQGRSLSKPLKDCLVQIWEDEEAMLRSVRHSTEVAFVFQRVTDDPEGAGEDLLMILKGIGVVLKVRQNDVRPVGFFQGEDVSPRALASADVKALEARFRDVEFGGVRHQVLPLR